MTGTITGIILAALFALLSLSNWCTVIAFFKNGKTGSMIPIIGSLAGMGSLYLLNPNFLSVLWWVPCVVDAGCLLWFVLILANKLGFLKGSKP